MLCVCVFYIYHSNLKSLTPSKYVATVGLQTIFLRQFLGVFIIDLSYFHTYSLINGFKISSQLESFRGYFLVIPRLLIKLHTLTTLNVSVNSQFQLSGNRIMQTTLTRFFFLKRITFQLICTVERTNATLKQAYVHLIRAFLIKCV